MTLYKQRPLSIDRPSFRLLELELCTDVPGVDNIELHARLDTYDLRDGLDYDALSYTWGADNVLARIKVNDEWALVQQNLLKALQQLRLNHSKTGNSRKLWVDALCINQSDNVEKSQQVMLMRDIYVNASRVLALLGEPDGLSAVAFDTLEQFAVDDGTQDGGATCREIQDTAKERRMAVQLFLERSYFVRMWTIQEIVVARKVIVYCGSLALDYDRIHNAVRRMTGSGFYPFSRATTNLTYVGNWRASFLEMSAPDRAENLDLRLFVDSRDRIATDPRDKIYSLRGIANTTLTAAIKVDYDKSVGRVYTDFCKSMLRIRPDLLILSAVILRHRTTSTFGLPSFVPDWSLPTYGGGILQRYYRFKPAHLFRAAGATTSHVTIDDHSDIITLEGLRVDTVTRVIPIKSILTANETTSISVTETTLRELAQEAHPSATYPITGEASWIAFFRTLTADRTALSPRISDEYRSQYFTAFHPWSLLHQTSASESHNLPPAAWAEISKDIGTIIEDKDMFVTTQGYLGLGHEGFRAGDVVTVFCGGEVPFLLREIALGKKGAFQLLSECYVHGIMDGEVMDDAKRNPLELISLE